MAPAPISRERPLLILARLVAVLFLGGLLTLLGMEWVFSSTTIFSSFWMVALITFSGLFPIGVALQRRHRLAGMSYWLVFLLNLVGVGAWFLFHLDIQGPHLEDARRVLRFDGV